MKERMGGRAQTKFLVTHTIDPYRRKLKNYPPGVFMGRSCLFDLLDDPWYLMASLSRLYIIAHQVFRFTGMEKGKDIVLNIADVGSGYCEMNVLLQRHQKGAGSKIIYTGYNIDEDENIVARQINPDIHIVQIDIRNSGFLETTYDVIIFTEVLEHVTKEEGTDLVHTLWKNINNKGLLIMSVADPSHDEMTESSYHLHSWTRFELKELFESLDSCEVLDAFPINIPIRKLIRKYEQDQEIRRIPSKLARIGLGYNSMEDGTSNVVIARRAIR